jgi:Ca-activated chloride channel family protein
MAFDPAFLLLPHRRVLPTIPSVHKFFLVFAASLLTVGYSLCAPVRCHAQDSEEVVRVRTDLITIPVRIRILRGQDSRGSLIPALAKSDFQLFIDGRPHQIDLFAAGARSLEAVFLLDSSGSTREIVSGQREAAAEILGHFSGGSRVAVMAFDETARVIAPFMPPADLAQATFSFPVETNHHTAIFDSAVAAINLFARTEAPPSTRRVVIVISDGLDSSSRTDWRTVLAGAELRNVAIYCLQIALFVPGNGRLEVRKASKGFREMAERSGGKFYLAGSRENALSPGSKIDIGPLLSDIETDLRNQFVLGFYPSEELRDGEKHSVTVKLSGSFSNNLRSSIVRDSFTLSR